VMFFNKCPICNELIENRDGIDGATCRGFYDKTFHINCLNLNIDKKVLETVRASGSFLFFCDRCCKLQESVVMRSFLCEAEADMAELVENIRSSTQKNR
jgi:hypothetical protein